MRVNSVKKLLKEGKPVVGTWLTLGSISASRFLARMGFDYLTVDIEHNQMAMETATYMMGAIADANCPALPRRPASPTPPELPGAFSLAPSSILQPPAPWRRMRHRAASPPTLTASASACC